MQCGLCRTCGPAVHESKKDGHPPRLLTWSSSSGRPLFFHHSSLTKQREDPRGLNKGLINSSGQRKPTDLRKKRNAIAHQLFFVWHKPPRSPAPMTPDSQTSSKQHSLRVPDHPSGSFSPLRDIEAAEPHDQGVHLDDMQPTPRYTNRSARPHRRAAAPPWWASMFEHYLAASFMMVTSSMVSTFWIDNALPFCSKFWRVLGNADECYWRPNAFMILAACTGYFLSAFWWYNQHKRWPYQMQTIALSLVGGIVLSLILKAGLEHILRNTLTWSIFAGLMVSAVMDRRKAPRGGGLHV